MSDTFFMNSLPLVGPGMLVLASDIGESGGAVGGFCFPDKGMRRGAGVTGVDGGVPLSLAPGVAPAVVASAAVVPAAPACLSISFFRMADAALGFRPAFSAKIATFFFSSSWDMANPRTAAGAIGVGLAAGPRQNDAPVTALVSVSVSVSTSSSSPPPLLPHPSSSSLLQHHPTALHIYTIPRLPIRVYICAYRRNVAS